MPLLIDVQQTRAGRRRAIGLAIGLLASSFQTRNACAEPQGSASLNEREGNYSLRNEADLALNRGLSWLKERQNLDGSWSLPDRTGATALALIAFLQAERMTGTPRDSAVKEKAAAFLRSAASRTGSITDGKDTEYNSSLCLMALSINNASVDRALLARARAFLVKQSNRQDRSRGLIPYTTLLEALAGSRAIADLGSNRVNWKLAGASVRRCQISETATAEDRGGFLDHAPAVHSRESGALPERPNGLDTCAGFLALHYAGVSADDPARRAALGWLIRHLTLDENPGVGAAGYYRYVETLAKSLGVSGFSEFQLSGGKKVDWSRELVLKLIDLQRPDGSWINKADGSWIESDPVVATSRALIALEISLRRL